MKLLIAFGLGLATGCLLKKPTVQSQPKFMIVDDRESLSDFYLNPKTFSKLREYLKNRNLDQ